MDPELPIEPEAPSDPPEAARSPGPAPHWGPRERRTLLLLATVWVLTGLTLYVESEYWFATLLDKPRMHPNVMHKNHD